MAYERQWRWILPVLLLVTAGHCYTATKSADMDSTDCDRIGAYTIGEFDIMHVYASPPQRPGGSATRDACTVQVRGEDPNRPLKIYIMDIRFNDCGTRMEIYDGLSHTVSPAFVLTCDDKQKAPYDTRENGITIRLLKQSPSALTYRINLVITTNPGPDIAFEQDMSNFYNPVISVGAIVGIAIAGGLFFVALLAIAIYCIVKQRKKHLDAEKAEPAEASVYTTVTSEGRKARWEQPEDRRAHREPSEDSKAHRDPSEGRRARREPSEDTLDNRARRDPSESRRTRRESQEGRRARREPSEDSVERRDTPEDRRARREPQEGRRARREPSEDSLDSRTRRDPSEGRRTRREPQEGRRARREPSEDSLDSRARRDLSEGRRSRREPQEGRRARREPSEDSLDSRARRDLSEDRRARREPQDGRRTRREPSDSRRGRREPSEDNRVRREPSEDRRGRREHYEMSRPRREYV